MKHFLLITKKNFSCSVNAIISLLTHETAEKNGIKMQNETLQKQLPYATSIRGKRVVVMSTSNQLTFSVIPFIIHSSNTHKIHAAVLSLNKSLPRGQADRPWFPPPHGNATKRSSTAALCRAQYTHTSIK